MYQVREADGKNALIRMILRDMHEELGIRTESWSPLGQGHLLTNPVIGAVSAKHGRTPAQVVEIR